MGVETWKKRFFQVSTPTAHTCTTWQVIAACAMSKSLTTASSCHWHPAHGAVVNIASDNPSTTLWGFTEMAKLEGAKSDSWKGLEMVAWDPRDGMFRSPPARARDSCLESRSRCRFCWYSIYFRGNFRGVPAIEDLHSQMFLGSGPPDSHWIGAYMVVNHFWGLDAVYPLSGPDQVWTKWNIFLTYSDGKSLHHPRFPSLK